MSLDNKVQNLNLLEMKKRRDIMFVGWATIAEIETRSCMSA